MNMSSIFTWFVQQSKNQSHHSGSHLIYEQLARDRHCTAITGAMKKNIEKNHYHYCNVPLSSAAEGVFPEPRHAV